MAIAFIIAVIGIRFLFLVYQHKLSTGNLLRSCYHIGLTMTPTLVFTIVIAEILRDRYNVSPVIFGSLMIYALANSFIPGIFMKRFRSKEMQLL
jgi:hypothetical protein